MACAPTPTETPDVAVIAGARDALWTNGTRVSPAAYKPLASHSCPPAAKAENSTVAYRSLTGRSLSSVIRDDDDGAEFALIITTHTIQVEPADAILVVECNSPRFVQNDGVLLSRNTVLAGPSQTRATYSAFPPENATPTLIVRDVDTRVSESSTTLIADDGTVTLALPISTLSSAPSIPLGASTATTSQASTAGVSSALGPLLGGLLGGFLGLIAIVGAIWYIWYKRRRIFHRHESPEPAPPSPELDYKTSEYTKRRQSTPPTPTPTPPPYHYGLLGRPQSTLSIASSPHSPGPSRSRSHSSSVLTSYSPPPSASASTHMPTSTTPLPGATTAISTGPSLAASSRPSTPGVTYPAPLQHYLHQQQRVSWPRCSGSEDDERRSPINSRSERRPSRLSLTLANWNPETDVRLDDLRTSRNESGGDVNGQGRARAEGGVQEEGEEQRQGNGKHQTDKDAEQTSDPGTASQQDTLHPASHALA